MSLLPRIFASLLAVGLTATAATSLAARETCRLGAATDGRTYRLCESRDEVRLERAFGLPAPFDPFIDMLVRAETVSVARESTSPVSYLGIGGVMGLTPRFEPSFDVSFGARFSPALRADVSLTLGHRGSDRFADLFSSAARTAVLPLLARASLDVYSAGNFSIFVTAGGGVSHVEVTLGSGAMRQKTSRLVFTTAAGAGLSYRISPNVYLDLEWRYTRLMHPPIGATADAHDVRLSLRLPISH